MRDELTVLGTDPDAPNLKVLSVDDDSVRHAAIYGYLRKLGYEGRLQCTQRTCSDPAEVTDEDIAWADIVCLDHDMCQAVPTRTEGGLYVTNCPQPLPGGGSFNLLNDYCGCPTGRDMVGRMVRLPARPFVIIHTQNLRGGMVMRDNLLRQDFNANSYPADWWSETGWRYHLDSYFLWKGSQS